MKRTLAGVTAAGALFLAAGPVIPAIAASPAQRDVSVIKSDAASVKKDYEAAYRLFQISLVVQHEAIVAATAACVTPPGDPTGDVSSACAQANAIIVSDSLTITRVMVPMLTRAAAVYRESEALAREANMHRPLKSLVRWEGLGNTYKRNELDFLRNAAAARARVKR